MRFHTFADYWDAFGLGQGPAGTFVRSLERNKLQLLRGEVKRQLSLAAENTPFALPARVWAVRGTVPPKPARGLLPPGEHQGVFTGTQV